jgi:hypothetical protein
VRFLVLLAVPEGRFSDFFSPDRSGFESELLAGLELLCEPCVLAGFGVSTRVLAFSLPLVPEAMFMSANRCSELE